MVNGVPVRAETVDEILAELDESDSYGEQFYDIAETADYTVEGYVEDDNPTTIWITFDGDEEVYGPIEAKILAWYRENVDLKPEDEARQPPED